MGSVIPRPVGSLAKGSSICEVWVRVRVPNEGPPTLTLNCVQRVMSDVSCASLSGGGGHVLRAPARDENHCQV